MDKATDKQIYFLKTQGIDASMVSKQAASEIIKNIKEAPEQVPVVKPGYETPNYPKPITAKKPFDTKSYYVSYAKDIFCVTMEKGREGNLSFEELMQKCIALIKMAREQL